MRGTADTILKIGDVVTVLGRVSDETAMREMAWVSDMDNMIGKTATVRRLYEDYPYYNSCVKLDMPGYSSYWLVAEWLDVDPVEETYSDEDFDSILL